MNLGSLQRGIFRNGGIFGGPGERLYGNTYADTDEFQAALNTTPVDDGTAAYLLDDGSGSPGWAISYEDVPVNVSYETLADYDAAIVEYDIPTGIVTYIEDTGGWATADEGSAVPIATQPLAICGGNNATSPYQVLSHGTDSGSEIPLDPDDLIAAATVS